MSKKEKAAPLEEEKETAAAPAEDVPKSGETEETFAVTKEQMEKMEGLAKELDLKVVVGIGTVVNNIRDLARSYKEAQLAIEVGKVFDTERSIINYDNLGIGRLIYQLPTTLCQMFLQEVFKKNLSTRWTRRPSSPSTSFLKIT